MGRNVVRLALLGAFLYSARRFYRNWGATKEECKAVLPGDELVRNPAVQTTEAVSINASAKSVWPWLVQIGQDRGGLYSFESLENLLGLRFHNADRLHPEWQQLNVGDVVRLAPKGWLGLRNGIALGVVDVVPTERIVLRASSPELPWDAVWSFHLLPHWEDRARLLARLRTGIRHPGEVMAAELAGPATALLTRGILRGIKRRVEASPHDRRENSPSAEHHHVR
ncbi:hypothetical protein BMW24_015760 [Mycobacterium heckeshornense]|nr:hypothetical protein [Mycobacterium heckeshornense]KMV20915.1 hypothetical protein ACT16_19405 [Mycobacterium heckeshornense]MCV7034946.1 SRPBCC family protein [Mycobacterium heckeshornense]PIJ33238.1 hypothetical protein BMW24_015760 [Mycobacterium heckeshornense]